MQSRPSQSMLRPSALKLVLLAAACFYLVFILRSSFRIAGVTYFTLIDDAMVSMRYAQHLADGRGLVWNIGEKPVEGFTNPGWMFFMAVLHWFQLPAAKISAVVMGAAAIILLLNAYLVHQVCKAIQPDGRYGPLIAGTVTAFYFPLVFWSLRGMEVGILTLLISAAVLTAIRAQPDGTLKPAVLLSVIFVATILVRMDALLQVGIISLYVASRGKGRARGALLPALVGVLTIAAVLFLQRAYFGDFLPNTYYQKVVGASLADRVKNGLLAFNDYATRDTLMLGLVSLAGILTFRGMRTRETFMLGLLFLVQCGYSIYVGGDYAEPEVNAANRFITQGMPALIILFALTLDHVLADIHTAEASGTAAPSARAVLSIGIAAATLLIISGQPWVSWAIDNAPLLKADIRRVRIGLAIAQHTSPDATIAVHAAGQIPYYSNRRTIDLLGLNDPIVAKGPVTGPFYPGHDKWNYSYSILQLRPDLIADNWIKLGDFMKTASEYQELDNGMYVRKDSTLVDIEGLLNASP